MMIVRNELSNFQLRRDEITSGMDGGFDNARREREGRCSTAWMPSRQTMTWALLLVGIALRLRQYFFDRSLWNDESEVVLNILHRSPLGLLKPLENYQAAPIGFLWLEKLSVHLWGSGEMVLRLLPIFCGVASLFLFFAVARRYLSQEAIPIAMGLFAISAPLIYYASEVKPYSSDVAIALGIYLAANGLFERRLSRVVVSSLVGAAAIWFSFSSLFVLAGVGVAAFVAAMEKRGRDSLLPLAVVGLVWAGSFSSCYLIFIRAASGNQALIDYWRAAYAPLPPVSVSNILWYERHFFDLFSSPVGLAFTGIAATAAIVGAMAVRRRDFGRFLSLLLPIMVTLLASAAHRYPFQGRFVLFLVPSLLLLIAEGLADVRRMTWSVTPSFAVLLTGFLFLDPAVAAARQFARPIGVEEARSAIDYVQRHRSAGDILYCYYSAEFPLDYYRERGLIGPIGQVTGVSARDDIRLYRSDLDKLRGQKRVWFLFSHDWQTSGMDEQAYFLDYLDQIGKRLDGMQATGAAAYLYDLSGDGSATH